MQKNGSSGSRDGSSNSSEDYHTPILTQKEEEESETSPNHKSSGGSSMKNDSSSGLCSRFSSQNSSKFPPISSSTNKSVSLTPPSSSSSSDADYNELKILDELCCIHLESASRKVEYLRKKKEDLLLVNKAIKNRLFASIELSLSIRDSGGGSTKACSRVNCFLLWIETPA